MPGDDLTIGRKKVDIPVYSFEKHAREDHTTIIYSPHVLVLEGIFALYDPRVLELLDLRIFAEADADLCLSRRSKDMPFPLTFLANRQSRVMFVIEVEILKAV